MDTDLPKGITPEKLEELKNEHGVLHLLRHPDDNFPSVIVKSPTSAEYNRFKSEVSSDRKAVSEKALLGFLRRHVVYPSRDDLDGILEQYPGLSDTYGNKLAELAGTSSEAEAKKL